MSPRTRARNQFFFALGLLAVAIAGYLLTRPAAVPESTVPVATSSAEAATSSGATTLPSETQPTPAPAPTQNPVARTASGSSLEGTYVCLPKKGDGPHTLECALGLRADDGRHYALTAESADGWSQRATTPTNARIRVTGNIVPVEALSSDRWGTYDIVGVVDVTSFTVL